MKQMEVTLLGQSYRLGCPDGGEAALLEAVARVDREMGSIRDAGKVKARERIAVLAALNLAFILAERQAAAPAAQALGDGKVDLAALVRRIDQTLAQDGQLL